MTNMEYYRENIKALNYNFAKVDGEIVECRYLCGKCDFDAPVCTKKTIEWLMSEHKEVDKPVTLTAREKHFVEFIEKGFIARDKGGYLYWYEEKPAKENSWWISDCTQMRIVDTTLFPFITWDNEPMAVETLRKLQVKYE